MLTGPQHKGEPLHRRLNDVSVGGWVKWRLEFYSERRRTLGCYTVEAPTPAAALELGRRALFTEYPRTAPRTRSLFEQAQRIGGQDADGWVLYRIAKDGYTR